MKTNKENVQQPRQQNQNLATGDSYQIYVSLRGFLDSIEVMSVRYYSEARTSIERREKFDELEKLLKPVVQELKEKFMRGAMVACPEGLNDCGGCCVPYNCLAFQQV